MSTILKTQNLTKIYGSKMHSTTALNNVDIQIEEGEFIGIMGPSGAGKSTLLNILATIDEPTNGSVYYDNKDIFKMKQRDLADFRRESLGFIFQDFNLLDTLTAKENILLPLTISNMNHKEIEKRVEEAAEILGIQDILNKFPYEISGGQKQRTAAARAIVHNPKLILADEPTGALDSKSATELLSCFTRLNEEFKATILIVTHDPFAASFCKRVLFIKDGKIFTELHSSGKRKELYNKVIDVLAAMGGGIGELL